MPSSCARVALHGYLAMLQQIVFCNVLQLLDSILYVRIRHVIVHLTTRVACCVSQTTCAFAILACLCSRPFITCLEQSQYMFSLTH